MNSERQDRRLASRMITYWKSLKADNRLPDIRQFNPKALGSVWNHCLRLVINETEGRRLYKYEYMGPEIIKAYEKDLTGQQVTPSIRTLPGANIIKKLDASVPLIEPVLEQGKMINDKDQMIKYRSCVLPFSDKEYEISHVVIGLSWKIF